MKVQYNDLDQPVFAFYNDTVWYNQPDLSFNAGYAYKFDVSDPSNNGFTMVFGTEVDNINTVLNDTDKVIRNGTPGTPDADAYVMLVLKDYTEGSFVYFEESIAGMGYVDAPILLDVNTSSSNLTPSNNTNLPSIVSTTFTDSLRNVYFTHSYSFDGSQYIEFEDDLLKIGTSTFIIEYYAYKKENYDYMYSTSNTGIWGQPTGAFLQNDYGNQSWFKIHANTDPNTITGHEFKISSFNDTLDKWYHIKIKLENPGLSTMKITVEKRNESNWSEVTTTTQTVTTKGNYNLTSEYFRLGGWAATTTSGFKGYLADFKMYKDVDVSLHLYIVTVADSVFVLSGTLQLEVPFTVSESYIFDQSAPSNAGEQLVFGTTSDDKVNLYTTGVTIMGTPGQPGAYTQIDVPDPAPSSLFYYSLNSNGMGY